MADWDVLLAEFSQFLQMNEGRSARTSYKYGGYLRHLATFLAERSVPLAQVTPEQLEAFTGLYMHERGLRPRSRRAVVAAVKRFFRWLRARGTLAHDPSVRVPYPYAGKRLPVPMGLHHAEALLMAPGLADFRGRRDTAIIALLIGCGLRVSGLVALNESSLIWYPDDGRERLAVRTTEKGGKERLIPAPDECWALVRAYLGDPLLDGIDRALPDGDQVLFVSVANRTVPPDKYHGEARRLSRDAVWELLKRHGKDLGIPRQQLHPHALRHLYGTELAEQDVDVLLRQALMGHASPSSTEVYTHLAQRKLREAVDRGNPLQRMRTPVSALLAELKGKRS